MLAAYELRELEGVDSATAAKKNLVAAIKRVSQRLGNTPAVCRRCYVHPAIVQSYLDGHLAGRLERRGSGGRDREPHALTAEESAVLELIRDQAALAEAA